MAYYNLVDGDGNYGVGGRLVKDAGALLMELESKMTQFYGMMAAAGTGAGMVGAPFYAEDATEGSAVYDEQRALATEFIAFLNANMTTGGLTGLTRRQLIDRVNPGTA